MRATGAGRGLSRLSPTDKFFAGLRAAVIVLGAGWLLLTPHLEHRAQFAVLFAALLTYTLLIYAFILLTRWSFRRIYLSAQLLDLFLLFLLVRQTGGVHSVFALGFYLLVGLHSFYFGRQIGLMVATFAALALVLSAPEAFQAEPWLDSTVRVAFLYLIAWSAEVTCDFDPENLASSIS